MMGNFAAFTAQSREKQSGEPALSLRGCLSWLICFAEKAITKPATRFEPLQVKQIIDTREYLRYESVRDVPACDLFFAVTLASALLKHTATVPGTDASVRLQCLLATLLPLVRADFARVIEFERSDL